MSVLRTPDACFENLPGYDFAPHYVGIPTALGKLRMHYIDEGPRNAPVALMLHGEPSWCYVYRKIIGPVVAAGYRAIAPDYIGFGRSDKPTDRRFFTYQRHVDWVVEFINRLDLQRIVLVLQDWGGPIGLRVLKECHPRIEAVLVANTVLPNCEPPPNGIPEWPGAMLSEWAASTEGETDFPISKIVSGVFNTPPDPAVLSAYEAPYPAPEYKAGLLEFPSLIPVDETRPGVEENRRTWDFLEGFNKPFVTAFSENDPGTKPWETVFQRRIAGAAGQQHIEIKNCGHFVQEEGAEAFAGALLDLMKARFS